MEDRISEVLNSIPRLLTLQNRSPANPCYGCFDRNFWHFKTTDFPNAAAQMGAEVLARVWAWKVKDNSYFGNPQVLEWSKQGFFYLMKIQRRDGSFDEWYPRERGWAGPTGYVLHSLASGYYLLGETWEKNDKEKIKESVYKAARHLSKRDEGHILCNHVAMALLALWDSWEILQESWILDSFYSYWAIFEKHRYSEGWTLEYDGVDISYNMASLSFLARIHTRNQDKKIEEYAKKSCAFLKFFCYPDGSFGGRIGSRSTSHLYPFALEYWATLFSDASSMAAFFRHSSGVAPSIQDDRYLMYRLCDYIEATTVTGKKKEITSLPFEEKEDRIDFFHLSGIQVKKTSKYYFVCSLKRGGVFYLYDLKYLYPVMADGGVIGGTHKYTVSSQTQSRYWNTHMKEDQCSVQGPLFKVPHQYFCPSSFILFRLFTLLFGFTGSLSYIIKSFIRHILITGSRPVKKTHFSRSFLLEKEKVTVRDSLKGVEGTFYTGFDFSARYVPQSRYFQKHELSMKPKEFKRKQKRDYFLEREWKF